MNASRFGFEKHATAELEAIIPDTSGVAGEKAISAYQYISGKGDASAGGHPDPTAITPYREY